MKYCKKCITADTRPNIYILDDGIYTACHSFNRKKN